MKGWERGGIEILLIICCCYYFETNAGEAAPRTQRVIDLHSRAESLCLQTWFPGLTVPTAPVGVCTDSEAGEKEAITPPGSMSTEVSYQLRDLDMHVTGLGLLSNTSNNST